MQIIQLRTLDPEDRLDLLTKLYEASLKGVPIYIRYLNENLDCAGAIARIKVEKVTRRDRRKSIDYYGRERYDPNDTRVEYIWGRATWDKRSNTVEWSSANQDYEFLIGYVGPTEWYYKSKKDRVPKEAIPAYDRLGRKIQEGDFVTYILNTGVPSIEFGQVTKIVNGVDESSSYYGHEEYCAHVYCRNIKLDSDETVVEKRIKCHSNIVVVHDDLKGDLMMRRLSLG